MDEIVIVGGGGHAKVVISIIRKLGRYRILGYTDLQDKGELLGVSYLGADRELSALAGEANKLNAVLATGQIGLGAARRQLWERLQPFALTFPSIVSPDAVVNEESALGEAAVVMDGAVINSGTVIGKGAIVNTNSTIEHDVTLADWAHVGPGATICGGVAVGQYSMVGAGATVIQGIHIAEGCIVGAGATVVQDLTEAGVYIGCPAHRLR